MQVSKEIQSLKPYVPGKPEAETMREYGLSSVIKLASNENPLGPSPLAIEAAQQCLKGLHRYPDASSHATIKALSHYLGVETNKLILGNGSNELIDLLIRVFCEPGQSILTSEAAFIAYKICAQAARVNVLEAPMTVDLRFDLKALAQMALTHRPRVIFLANPNNPTGTYFTSDELKEFLQAVSGLEETMVVVDEAYAEFVRASDSAQSLDLLGDFPRLVCLRTFSKVYGLAGLRIGAMVAAPEIADFVNRVRNPFNVNAVAQVALEAALRDQDFLHKSQQVNWQGLDYFYGELDRLEIRYWRSQANFVLMDLDQPAAPIYEQLLKLGVILRPLAGYGLPNHLRMSVGLESENRVAIEALEKVLT